MRTAHHRANTRASNQSALGQVIPLANFFSSPFSRVVSLNQREMDFSLTELDRNSIAVNTRKSYLTGIRKWIRHRKAAVLPLFVTSRSQEEMLRIKEFIQVCSNSGGTKKLSLATMKSHIAAIRWWHAIHGYSFPSSHPTIEYALKSIGRTTTTRQLHPLTADLLRTFATTTTFSELTRGQWTIHKQAWCALLLMWNLMLRVSEALGSDATTIPQARSLAFHWIDGSSVTADSIGVLSAETISLAPSRLTLHIRSSKTDQDERGYALGTDRTDGPLCAVSAMFSYCIHRASQGHTDGPLFPGVSKRHLTALIDLMATAASFKGRYNTHSIRSGAATSLVCAGAPIDFVKLAGRWSSFAISRYIRVSPALQCKGNWVHSNRSVAEKMQGAPPLHQ